MEAEREEAPPEEAEGAARSGPLAALAACFPLGKAKKPQYGQVQADGESSILDAEPGKRPISFAEKLLVMAGQKRVLGRGGKDDEPLLFALTWAQPQRFGTPPSPRNGHSMTLIGMHLYVFGGGDENLSFNDVHTLHVGNMAWDKPLLHGTMPSPRSRHSATALGNNMVVFGGVGGGNDLHILEAPHPPAHNGTHVTPTPHPTPSPRATSSPVRQTDTLTWYVPKVGGEPPLPRFGHTCNLVESKVSVSASVSVSVSVLCAYCLCHTYHATWSRPRSTGRARSNPNPNPNPNFNPNPDPDPDPDPDPNPNPNQVDQSRKLYIFGGHDGRRSLADLHIFDTESMNWSKAAVS